jgi:uncharacterized OB-fold protein
MARPVPHPDTLTAPYWADAQAGKFALPRCEACGRHHFYPRPACPHCGSDRIAWVEASGRGTVYSFSVVHRAPGPAFAGDVPYVVAIVETAEGPHLLSRVVGIALDQVRIGLPVRVAFERVSDDAQLPVFTAESAR